MRTERMAPPPRIIVCAARFGQPHGSGVGCRTKQLEPVCDARPAWYGPRMADFKIWHDIEVRFRDTDAMGHVNNAVYLTYLEVARQSYWQRFSQQRDYAEVPFVVARVGIDFRAPMHVDEVARVKLRTSWVSRSSFAMQYVIEERDSQRRVVEAESVQVTFDYDAQRSMLVPQWLRDELERIEGGALPDRPGA